MESKHFPHPPSQQPQAVLGKSKGTNTPLPLVHILKMDTIRAPVHLRPENPRISALVAVHSTSARTFLGPRAMDFSLTVTRCIYLGSHWVTSLMPTYSFAPPSLVLVLNTWASSVSPDLKQRELYSSCHLGWLCNPSKILYIGCKFQYVLCTFRTQYQEVAVYQAWLLFPGYNSSRKWPRVLDLGTDICITSRGGLDYFDRKLEWALAWPWQHWSRLWCSLTPRKLG